MSTWILLRGLTRERGHWGPFLDAFRQALPPGDQVLSPDLPGNGLLHAMESPTRVEAMVSDCRRQLREQGLTPPYHVLAMSLGAMVTVAWADAYPQELACGVLINTSLRPYSVVWQRLRPGNYGTIGRLLLTRADAPQWEAAILRMTTRHPADPQGTLARWIALRTLHPVSTRNGLRQLWAATRYRAPRAAPHVPLLLLNGLGDRLVHPDCSETLARAWRLPLLRHPTAGHDLPLDAPSWVLSQVMAWPPAGWGAPADPAHRPAPPGGPRSGPPVLP
jgi:pimeloyl-ACP methyl ester carboxylesterase